MKSTILNVKSGLPGELAAAVVSVGFGDDLNRLERCEVTRGSSVAFFPL